MAVSHRAISSYIVTGSIMQKSFRFSLKSGTKSRNSLHSSKSVMNFSTENTFCHEKFCSCCKPMLSVEILENISDPHDRTVTVTVTEALVLRPPTRRPRTHHRVNPYPGAHRQNETKMFSDNDKTRNPRFVKYTVYVTTQARMQRGVTGVVTPPKFIRSKIFWVNFWQLYYSDSTVFKFCTSMWLWHHHSPVSPTEDSLTHTTQQSSSLVLGGFPVPQLP